MKMVTDKIFKERVSSGLTTRLCPCCNRRRMSESNTKGICSYCSTAPRGRTYLKDNEEILDHIYKYRRGISIERVLDAIFKKYPNLSKSAIRRHFRGEIE